MHEFSPLGLWGQRLRWITVVLALLIVAFSLPSGFYLMEPGMAIDMQDVVVVNGCPHRPGVRFLLTTVAASRATVGQVLLKGLLPHTWVVPERSLYPAGMTEGQYVELMKKEMRESQRVASYLAFKHAGYEVSLSSVGQGAGEGAGQAAGGFPVPVIFKETPAAGPSAGLMFMLELYARLDALQKGRCAREPKTPLESSGKPLVVAGTGALSSSGKVSSVGGVAAKVFAAERAGATLFIVPWENLAEAVRVAGSMTVVGVRDTSDAIQKVYDATKQ